MKKTVQSNNQWSKFWMADDWSSDYDSFLGDKDTDKKDLDIEGNEHFEKVEDMMKLAGFRRAIGNFVRIVTDKEIPVTFKVGDDSYTDGKQVVLSAKIDDKNFDSTVGLALHEGSHIKLSDFALIRNIENNIPAELFTRSLTKKLTKDDVKGYVKDLLNWVEDRRIDNFIYTTSPGYRGYYVALYDRYFNSEIISKGLQSTEHRTETFQSYFHRIINLTNPKTDFDALKALRAIALKADLKNIARLKTSQDALGLAKEIYVMILDAIDADQNEKEQKEAEKNAKEGAGEGGNGGKKKVKITVGGESGGEGGGSGEPLEIGDDDELEIEFAEPKEGQGSSSKNGKGQAISLSPTQMKKLQKAMDEQRKFLRGDIKKTKMSKRKAELMDQIGQSGASVHDVAYDAHGTKKEHVKVILIKNVTEAVFASDMFPFGGKYSFSDKTDMGQYEKETSDGIRLGTMLGRKLQVRNEEKSTRFTRKNDGHIDKRLLAECGFGAENIFAQTYTERYTKAIMHLSLDLSGSMSGDKLGKAITTSVAIAKAGSMIENLEVVISLRGTSRANEPLIAILYDSRRDTMVKVRRFFPYLHTAGTTPEGLCFSAAANEIVSSSKDIKSYFVNFSDGEPYYGMYSGEIAIAQTAHEIKKMKERGIEVLSYFISSYEWDRNYQSTEFKRMYGKNASFVNPGNLFEVARSLNDMFLGNDQKSGRMTE